MTDEPSHQQDPAASDSADTATSPVDDVKAPKPYRPAYVFLAVVSSLTLAIDLGSKWWAEKRLPGLFRGIEVIKGHLNFIWARNPGGAWGLLQNESESIRRPFFMLISVAAVAFIISLFRKLHPNQTALKWGLPLVLGGALGNLVDRIRYGHVIDFIQVKLTPAIPFTYPWPTFNVADIAIVVGVGFMAIDMFTSRKSNQATKEQASSPPSKPEGLENSASSKEKETQDESSSTESRAGDTDTEGRNDEPGTTNQDEARDAKEDEALNEAHQAMVDGPRRY